MKSIIFMTLICLSMKATYGQKTTYIATDSAISELNKIIKTIEEVHYNAYFSIEKEQFTQQKDALINSFDKDSIPLKRYMSTGMKLVALMSGGHTAMDWQCNKILPELAAFQYLPFTGELSENNDQFTVTKTLSKEIQKGDVIHAINGISIIDLYQECMSYLGGIPNFKKANCAEIFPLYLFFTEKVAAPYSVQVKDATTPIQSWGITIEEFSSLANQDQPEALYTFDILEDNIGLISYNSCTDRKAFKKFLKTTFKEIETKNVSQLIIDVRENSGGDSGLNDDLLAYLTTKTYRQSSGRYWKVSKHSKLAYKTNQYEKHFGKKFMDEYYATENQAIIDNLEEEFTTPVKPKNYFEGKTCFLIGPKTFSSANFLADAIKTYKLSTLIGSATGEYTNDFGEQISFSLNHSGCYIYVSSTYDIGANGNPSLFEPVHPDIEVKDNVLPYAINWIKSDAPTP